MDLADGTRCSGMAPGRGTAMINLLNDEGRMHRAQLPDSLYRTRLHIPTTFFFQVSRATGRGATQTFKQRESHMVTKDGNKFIIREYEKLYNLPTVNDNDHFKVCHAMTSKPGMRFSDIVMLKMYSNSLVW